MFLSFLVVLCHKRMLPLYVMFIIWYRFGIFFHVFYCFAGNLFPVNERATRTIRNLYVENERVISV